MRYVDRILERANTQHIRGYLTGGCEPSVFYTEDYETRMREAYRKYTEVVQKHHIDEESELFEAFNSTLSEYEAVYMEIGIRAGFRLALDLLGQKEGGV